MNEGCHRVPLSALPGRAAAQLKRFLFAYQLFDNGRFVIRHADPSNNRIEELEFDPRVNRFLSPDERLRLRESERRQLRLPSGYTVQVSYRIEPQRSCLLAHYDVRSGADGEKTLEIEQEMYAPTPSDPIAAITHALDHAQSPLEYARWHEDRKIEYWAMTLHRLRRAKGELGRDEDEVFTAALLHDMERTDPNVRSLLPGILLQLARLDQVDPTLMETTFMQRVGLRRR
jgi:hypothetical protein